MPNEYDPNVGNVNTWRYVPVPEMPTIVAMQQTTSNQTLVRMSNGTVQVVTQY